MLPLHILFLYHPGHPWHPHVNPAGGGGGADGAGIRPGTGGRGGIILKCRRCQWSLGAGPQVIGGGPGWTAGHEVPTIDGSPRHDGLATRRTAHGNGQAEGCYVPRSETWPRKWTSWGPEVAVGEGSPTTSLGCPLGCTWPTARVVPLLCVDPTQSSEKGTVRASLAQSTRGKGRVSWEVSRVDR